MMQSVIGGVPHARSVVASRPSFRRLVALCLLGGLAFSLSASAAPLAPPEPLPDDFLQGAFRLRATFAPVGKTLALSGEFFCNSAHAPCGLILWDLAEDCKKVVVQKELILVRAFAFSPDGKTFATVHERGCPVHRNGNVKLWDTASCKKLADLGEHPSRVDTATFSPDGKLLATAGCDGKVMLWDVARRKEAASLALHSSSINSVSFSPDGKLLASAGDDGKLLLTEVATGAQVGSMGDGTDEDYFSAVCFSPEGWNLATGGPDVSRVTLWETATRGRRATFPAEGLISCLAFGPKGKLASGCRNGTLQVRDVYSGKAILSLKLDTGVGSVSFSPDGRILAASIGTDQVKLWDMTTGKEYVPEKPDE